MPNNTITALKISGNRYFGVMTPNLKFWLKLSSVCMEEVSMKMIPNINANTSKVYLVRKNTQWNPISHRLAVVIAAGWDHLDRK